MDFLDPKKRRSYNIRLFIGFILIAIAIVLGTTILALITAGYNINQKTGQIIQDGLVFINSQPVSANIYLNGVQNGTTNSRLNLSAGNYNLSLSQAGYHSWTNNIVIFGGDVLQLIYPYIFPINPIKTTISIIPSQPTIATSSPDRHWMLVSIPDQNGSFYNVDITNTKTAINTVSIPSNILGNFPGTNILSVVEWSTDNQHVLFKDTYQGGIQYIMFDRITPSNSFNVNQTFSSTTFTSVSLDNKSFDKLYLYNQTSGDLLIGDVNTKQISPILNNVISYWPYSNNQILYVTSDTKNNSVVDAKLWKSDGTSFVLKQLPVSNNYQLNMASYNNNLYIVVGSSGSNYAYIYMNPSSSSGEIKNNQLIPTTLLALSSSAQKVTFSASARFIALQSGQQFAVYDIQYDRHYRYQTNLNFQANEYASWMDGNRLYAVTDSKLNIWDFDGTNTVDFITANANITPLFNRDYNAVYSIIPDTNPAGQWKVIRNSLIANKP